MNLITSLTLMHKQLLKMAFLTYVTAPALDSTAIMPWSVSLTTIVTAWQDQLKSVFAMDHH